MPTTQMAQMHYKNKRVLITGCCGTVGNALVKELSNADVEIIGVDSNESEIFFQSLNYLPKGIEGAVSPSSV